MTFRERLREQIDYCGFLDKEVASMAGISKRTIDSYVGSEACMPSAEVAVRIAKVLGVTVEYLVTGEKDSRTLQNNEADIYNEKTRNLLKHFSKLSNHDKDLLVSFAETMEKAK
ncbi:helix-turn-helix domain-containing protein [Treponema bryantii]|uniref:helix-turn-helix domain-containing protein n=1 Tax=Treponema bryantii TaxID=163 RepID=UPI0003B38763|nr:helix-turn-helix transcriptional regulator [Treponema bryantii]